MSGPTAKQLEPTRVVSERRPGVQPSTTARLASSTAEQQVLELQGQVGNRAVQKLLSSQPAPSSASNQAAADRDAEVDADVQLICKKLDRFYFSDADETDVLAILSKWAHAPNPARSKPRAGSRYLEQLFTKLQQKTKDVGVLADQRSSYYSLLFNRASRPADLATLRDAYAPQLSGDAGAEEISFGGMLWENVKKGVVRDQIYAYNEGLREGANAGIEGLLTAVSHPIDTAKGISHAVTHFDQTRAGIEKLATNYWNTAAKDPVEFARMTGNIAGQVEVAIAAPTIVKGGGELLVAGAARVAPTVARFSRLAVVGASLGMDYSFRPMAGGTSLANVTSAVSTTSRGAAVVEGVAAAAPAVQEATQAVSQVVNATQKVTQAAQEITAATTAAPSLVGAVTVGAPTATMTAAQAVAPIAGAVQVSLTPVQFAQAMAHVFPSQYADPVLQVVEQIGQQAAQAAIANPAFVQACQNGNWALAGTLFHSAAATVGPAFTNQLPPGFQMTFENTIQAGLGGSRFDVLVTGPGVHREVDWKTTGRSAISHVSRTEMIRHANQYPANIGTPLTGQESKSWIDFVRPFLPGINWPR